MKKSPFPGMDPYLEQFWGDVHSTLVVYLRDQINDQLPSDLQARVEEGLMVDTETYSRRIDPDVQVIDRPEMTFPNIAIPLRPTDPDIVLQLQPLLEDCYRRGRYASLDYTRPLTPSLDSDDQTWTDQLLRSISHQS